MGLCPVAVGGGTGTRTLDIQLAKLALYQLSYTPLPSERRESRDKKLNRALRATSHAQVKDLIVRAIARFSTPRIHGCPWQGVDLSQRRLSCACEFLRRKEVIQPQVPLRLPCYDFIPVTSYTLGPCLLAVGSGTSGATGFHDVTGGVYKTRERIHRDMLIRDY